MGIKSLLVVVSLLIIGGTVRAQSDATVKKPKAVHFDFDGKEKPQHKLSKAEMAERLAYVRHLKRLRADYTQSMPAFK